MTAKLYQSAQVTAQAIEAQKEPKPDDGGSGDGDGVPAPPTGIDPPTVPTDDAPSEAASPSAVPSVPPGPVAMPATELVDSSVAGGLLPLLILLGAIGCLVALGLRLTTTVTRRRR